MAKTLRQKDINFLSVLEGRKAKPKRGLLTFLLPGILLLVALVGGGIFAYLQVNITELQKQSDEIRNYLSSANTTRQISEANSLKSQAASMQQSADTIATPMENLMSYPSLTSGDYEAILEMAGANIEVSTFSFAQSTGTLSFTASTEYLPSIETFVAQMRNSGLFSDITYTGFSGGSSQLTTPTNRSAGSSSATTDPTAADADVTPPATVYQFSLVCVLAPPPVVDVEQPAEQPEGGQ